MKSHNRTHLYSIHVGKFSIIHTENVHINYTANFFLVYVKSANRAYKKCQGSMFLI